MKFIRTTSSNPDAPAAATARRRTVWSAFRGVPCVWRLLLLVCLFRLGSTGRAGVLELDGYGSYAELPEGMGGDWVEFTLELRVRWDHLGYFDSPLHFGEIENGMGFNHQAWGFRTPVFFVQPASRQAVKTVGGTILEAGQWIHLAATVSAQGVRLYANGTCVATNTAGVPMGILKHSHARWLGRSPWEDNGYFRGAIDDVCVWDRILTDDEIGIRSRSPINGDESGLVAAWTFESSEDSANGPVSWSVGRERRPARLKATARVAAGQPLITEPFPVPSRVEGVVRTDASPSEAGRVRLWSRGRVIQEAETGPGGKFRIDLITPAAELELEAIHGGFGLWRRVAVAPGVHRSLQLDLQSCRSIAGRVTTVNGIPQSGVEVLACFLDSGETTPAPGWPSKISRTDIAGRYEFLNLPEGFYRVVCVAASDSLLSAPALDPEYRCEVRTGRVSEAPDFQVPRLHGRDAWRPLEGLPEPDITALATAPDGTVWLGTSGGLSRYDGTTVSTWRRTDGLPAESVTALALDSHDDLWIGSPNGLVCMREGHVLPVPGVGAPARPVVALAAGPDSVVWVGTVSGLYRWDGKLWSRYGPGEGLPSNIIRGLKALQNGVLLIWTDGGWVEWKEGRLALKTEDYWPSGLPDAPPEWGGFSRPIPPMISSQWETSPRGETWATKAGRLYRFNGRRWSSASFREDDAPSGEITALAMDSRGTIWLGIRGKGAWHRVDDCVGQLNEADGLPGRMVRCTERTPDGSLWIGTDGGLARWHGGSLQTWTPLKGFPARQIYSLKVDQSGRLWVGTDAGAFWFDGDRYAFATGSPKAPIRAISEGPDATVWLATWGAGMFSWTARDGLKSVSIAPNESGDYVSSILAAQDGVVWYAYELALARVTPSRMYHAYLVPNQVNGKAASGYRVATTNHLWQVDPQWRTATSVLAESMDGDVWAGTTSQGLLRYRAGEWSHFPAGVGPPSARILAAQVTADGRFWCGTPVGACLFDGELWSVLDTRDGLSGNEVGSIRSDPDGTLWFGTDQGLTRYVPLRKPSTLGIAAVENGESHRLSNGSVTVGVGERTSITASTDRMNRVRWRITGPKGEVGAWSALSTSPSLVWRPPVPGSYIIEAMAVDRDLNRSQPARVGVYAIRPWFRSPWVVGGVLAGGCGMAVATTWMALRARRLRREAELWRAEAVANAEKERMRGQFTRVLIHSQEAERRRLSSELHDSLGQELLLIRNTALLAAQTLGDSSPAGPLADIAERAARTIDDVRTIAYALRPQELDRLGLVSALRTLCEEMTETAGLELHFETEPLVGLLPPDAEISLYRAVQETLSNVVRHARAQRVSCSISIQKAGLCVALRDDGVGFQLEKASPTQTRAGLGLVSMNERMRLVGGVCSITPGSTGGTCVEFRVPLQAPTPGGTASHEVI